MAGGGPLARTSGLRLAGDQNAGSVWGKHRGIGETGPGGVSDAFEAPNGKSVTFTCIKHGSGIDVRIRNYR